MREISGDIREQFNDYKWNALCCTINTVVGSDGLIMGAGVALTFKEWHRFLPYIWGERIQRWKLPRTHIIVTTVDTDFTSGRVKYAIGFPTKRDFRQPSELALIERSAKQLQVIIEAMDWSNVLLPRPGCSNGGLEWKNVKPILEPIFDDRVTIISKEP